MSYGKEPRKFWGALAAIVVAVEGAILLTRKTAQVAPTAVVSLTKDVMDLLIAMAQGIGSIIEKLDDILAAIKAIPIGEGSLEKLDQILAAIRSIPGGVGGGGVGYPPNADAITALFVGCSAVQPSAFQLPNIAIPDTMELQLLARNPGGANTGVIYAAGSAAAAGTTGQARPLIPGATIGYKVKNANCIFIGATVAGEGVYLTVEQRT